MNKKPRLMIALVLLGLCLSIIPAFAEEDSSPAPTYTDYVQSGSGSYGPVSESWYNSNVVNSQNFAPNLSPASDFSNYSNINTSGLNYYITPSQSWGLGEYAPTLNYQATGNNIAGYLSSAPLNENNITQVSNTYTNVNSGNNYFSPNFTVTGNNLQGVNADVLREAARGAESRGWSPSDGNAYIKQVVAEIGGGSFTTEFNQNNQLENLTFYGGEAVIPILYKTTEGNYTVISPSTNINAAAVAQAADINLAQSTEQAIRRVAPNESWTATYADEGTKNVTINVTSDNLRQQAIMAELPSSKFLAPDAIQNISTQADDVTPEVIRGVVTQIDQQYARGGINSGEEYGRILEDAITSSSTNKFSGSTAVYDNNNRLLGMGIHVMDPEVATSTQNSTITPVQISLPPELMENYIEKYGAPTENIQVKF